MTTQNTIESFAQWLKTEEKSDKTIRNYKIAIEKLLSFTGKEYTAITMLDIQAFVANEQAKGNVGSSINLHISGINNFYRYCNEFEIFKNALHYGFVKDKGRDQRIKSRDYIDPEQLQMFIDKNTEYFRKHQASFALARRWVILYLLAMGALREFEICGLQESDVSFLIKDEVYQLNVLGKGGKWRKVFLPEEFREPLELYLKLKKEHGFDCPNLLCTFKNKQLDTKTINDNVDWMTEHADIRTEDGRLLDLSPHRIRHGAADFQLFNGVDIGTVSKNLGHSNVGFTAKVYTRGHTATQKESAKIYAKKDKANT